MIIDSMPFFSIIIPTYNRADIISRTIESVLNQNFIDFELIVVDDGGTDETAKVINSFNDKRILYCWKENEERGSARNFGISKSTGSYVTFLDSDDRFMKDNLSQTIKFIKDNNAPPWLHFSYRIVDVNGIEISKIKHSNNPEYSLLTGNNLSCLGVFVRRDVIKQHNFEEDRILSGSEDWVLWMRLASRYPLLVSNEITSELVHHEERSVLKVIPDILKTRIKFAGSLVMEDKAFKIKFAGRESLIWAHLNLYTSLHLALANYRNDSINYLLKALNYPAVLLTRKPYTVIQKLIFNA